VAPTTDNEKALAEIWADVLDVKQVGVLDDFFELGGHSLQALQLVSKIEALLGHDISIKTIFSCPNVAALAQALSQEASADQTTKNAHFNANGNGRTTATTEDKEPSPPSSLKTEHRPLLSLWATGELEAIDAAALYYLEDKTSGYEQSMYAATNGMPFLVEVTETNWGRLGLILLPRFMSDLYGDRAGLLAEVVQALNLAGRLGAQVVSLTGLIPSATDYGRAILPAVHRQGGLPQISTGHATTTAAVVLNVARILAEGGRHLPRERVGFLGLGSIGTASLRLMLHTLPHPQEILLCDLYHEAKRLETLRREIIETFGFRGKIRLLESRTEPPPPFYEATLMVGATSVPKILDVGRLRAGTLIVDDSGPHCFDPQLARRRIQQEQDILFTEGGVLQLPHALKRIRFVPDAPEQTPDAFQTGTFAVDNAYEIMGCTFSSLLSTCFEKLKPTLGIADVDACTLHYQTLKKLGISGASLHCEAYQLTPEAILRFRHYFSHKESLEF
jgi:predicted amino acid dehydrogenase/acyl carrier protein